MQGDISTQEAGVTTPARPARRGGYAWPLALLLFVALVILAGWLAITGKLDFLFPSFRGEGVQVATGPASVAGPGVAGAGLGVANPQEQAQEQASAQARAQASMMVGGVETRLALLEERMSRLDQQARAASGHATRAEALLVAAGARRVIARGGELGILENQLRLRFGGAQPQAVSTIIAFGKDPVTIDQLASGLDALAPALANSAAADGNGWEWLRRELSSMFVVRSAPEQGVQQPSNRLARARMMLVAGKTAEAIDEVARLPGADLGAGWIASARRYQSAQQALDVIETAALLEPRLMSDLAPAPDAQSASQTVPDAAAQNSRP